jgi:hypothetical protein
MFDRPPTLGSPGTVIDGFTARRRLQIDRDRQRRLAAFDAELTRRLSLFRAGLPVPVERIADNPY